MRQIVDQTIKWKSLSFIIDNAAGAAGGGGGDQLLDWLRKYSTGF